MQRLEVSGAVGPLYGSLGFKGLKISTSFHKWLAAETRSADGGFLQETVNRQEVFKLPGRSGIFVTDSRQG